jgi:hypothetical protein
VKELTIDGKTYTIFFRYLSKFGKRPHFGRHAPFQAITICTVMQNGGKFIAQDVAVCSEAVAPKPTPAMHKVLLLAQDVLGGRPSLEIARAEAELRPDQYSRRQGRLISLCKTIDRCGALRKIELEFMSAYLALDPGPDAGRTTVQLSDERKEELMAAGEERRAERLSRKQAGA